jgi:hypothetical protein
VPKHRQRFPIHILLRGKTEMPTLGSRQTRALLAQQEITLSMIRNDEQSANRREQDHVETGCALVHEAVRSDLPFGDVKASGSGRKRKEAQQPRSTDLLSSSQDFQALGLDGVET